MTVRSEPLINGQQVKASRYVTLPAAAVLFLLFGLPLWIAGARYTVDGWRLGLNWFFDWLNVPLVLGVPEWRVYVACIIIGGVLYSLIEVDRPSRRTSFTLWLLWLLVIASDLSSTFLGVVTPPRDAWPLTRFIASVWPLAGLWTIVLTFVPEMLLLAAVISLYRWWRLLNGSSHT